MTAPGAHEWTLAHRVDKRLFGSPIRHRAECSCGWVGEDRRKERDAEGDGFAHQAMGPPPKLDEAA